MVTRSGARENMPKFPKIPRLKKLPLDIRSIARALGQSESLAADKAAGSQRLVGDLMSNLRNDPQAAEYLRLAQSARPAIAPTQQGLVSEADLLQSIFTAEGWRGAPWEQQAKLARKAMTDYLNQFPDLRTPSRAPLITPLPGGGVPETEEGARALDQIMERAHTIAVAPTGPRKAPPGVSFDPDKILSALNATEKRVLLHRAHPEIHDRPDLSGKHIDKILAKIRRMTGFEKEAPLPHVPSAEVLREQGADLRPFAPGAPEAPQLELPGIPTAPRRTKAPSRMQLRSDRFGGQIPLESEITAPVVEAPKEPPVSLEQYDLFSGTSMREMLEKGLEMVKGMMKRKGPGRRVPAEGKPKTQPHDVDYEALRRREFE